MACVEPPNLFSTLHESLLHTIVSQLGIRTRSVLGLVSREARKLAEDPDCLRNVDLRNEPGLQASALLRALKRARGVVEVLRCADRRPEAAASESKARFAHGLRYCDAMPYTLGRFADVLASLLPNVQELVMDEQTSCLGGMTDDFALAIAGSCPKLRRLEVRFARGPVASLPSELFTDEGLIALSERLKGMQALVLHNCAGITDRSMYALAANSGNLQELSISGYSERVTDGGIGLLLAAAGPRLRMLRLSSKLHKVGDRSVIALLGASEGISSSDGGSGAGGSGGAGSRHGHKRPRPSSSSGAFPRASASTSTASISSASPSSSFSSHTSSSSSDNNMTSSDASMLELPSSPDTNSAAFPGHAAAAAAGGAAGAYEGGYEEEEAEQGRGAAAAAAAAVGAPQLRVLKLSSAVTDASIEALGSALQGSSYGAYSGYAYSAAAAVAQGPAPLLEELLLPRCTQVSSQALVMLLASGRCRALRRLVLPAATAQRLPARVRVAGGGDCVLSVGQAVRGKCEVGVRIVCD